ncbi:hypothetical protein EKH55_3188 [Sinorhizobium alkalisoli]|nr:hypothetical protein EKH55_3188 [Sinorhizobium alkalisoli]
MKGQGIDPGQSQRAGARSRPGRKQMPMRRAKRKGRERLNATGAGPYLASPYRSAMLTFGTAAERIGDESLFAMIHCMFTAICRPSVADSHEMLNL